MEENNKNLERSVSPKRSVSNVANELRKLGHCTIGTYEQLIRRMESLNHPSVNIQITSTEDKKKSKFVENQTRR